MARPEIRKLPKTERGTARFRERYPGYHIGRGSCGLPQVHDWPEVELQSVLSKLCSSDMDDFLTYTRERRPRCPLYLRWPCRLTPPLLQKPAHVCACYPLLVSAPLYRTLGVEPVIALQTASACLRGNAVYAVDFAGVATN